MRVIARIFLVLPAVFVAWGCHAPAIPDGPTAIVMQVSDREAFLDAAASELRSRDFPIERIDPYEGVLVTEPSTSQQWLEFWRRDALGAYQLTESSIHTIRRIVTVRLNEEPARGADECRVSVEVEKERFSAPERQVTTASGALAVFSEHLPTVEGEMGPRSIGAHWVPLGRDPLLEADLLERFTGIKAIESPAPEPKQSPAPQRESPPGTPEAIPLDKPESKPAPELKRSSPLIKITDA